MESGWKTPKKPTAGMHLGEQPDPCFQKYAAGEICSVDGKESIGVITLVSSWICIYFKVDRVRDRNRDRDREEIETEIQIQIETEM